MLSTRESRANDDRGERATDNSGQTKGASSTPIPESYSYKRPLRMGHGTNFGCTTIYNGHLNMDGKDMASKHCNKHNTRMRMRKSYDYLSP
jgi:hypothetical protein